MQNSKLTKKKVKHVAKLAKLTLRPSEVAKFEKQLSEVLDYFKILAQLNTEKVKPTSQVTGLENVEREDKVFESLAPKEVLSGRLFKTDIVIRK